MNSRMSHGVEGSFFRAFKARWTLNGTYTCYMGLKAQDVGILGIHEG